MSLSRRHFIAISASLALIKLKAIAQASETLGLKDIFKQDFLIGTAVPAAKLHNTPTLLANIIQQEFNALTLENEMKWNYLQPQENQWQWRNADTFVQFCQAHNLYGVGHTLVWHEQIPPWVFKTANNQQAPADLLERRMHNHIGQVMSRYRGKIKAWDVVNEALDGGSWRKSSWYKILGEDYFHRAFNVAHEADPDACLIYNDFNLEEPAKRAAIIKLLNTCKQRKTPIHAVGLQCHMGLNFPSLDALEQSIIALANTGVRLHITELDVDVLPFNWQHPDADLSKRYQYSAELDPYSKGLPPELEQRLAQRYVELFKLWLKHKDKIDRITLWGVGDGESWKNDFPIPGRTNYPLLFNRQLEKKPCYQALAGLKKSGS